MPTPGPALSVIIPVRNGGDVLGALIAALERQTLPRDRFEVLVADDGSTDGATENIATDDGWLRVLPGTAENPYAARNRASREARGEILVFSDADCEPVPDWLEKGLAALEEADLVAGLVRFRTKRRSVWALLDMETFLDQEKTVRKGRAVTANLFVRRELFGRVGGFDASLPNGGDQEFVARAVADGGRLVFAREPAVYHPARDSAREFLGKVWTVNRRHGVRVSRTGARPDGVTLRGWVPLVQTLRSRRRSGRGLLLDRRRLADSSVEPSRLDEARVLPFMYLVVPYLGRAAQVVGWWEGRRMRPQQSRRG